LLQKQLTYDSKKESYLGDHHLASIIYTIVRFKPKTPITIIKALAQSLPFLALQKRRNHTNHPISTSISTFPQPDSNAPSGQGPYENQLNTNGF